jgi:uncharacterized damage-inducible protein DinB
VSVRAFYADWADYNRRFIEAVGRMSAADLALLVPDSTQWPVWAVVGHMAGMRVYWLCIVAGEPGAERTPFTDVTGLGWEDDLDRTRTVDELVTALETTWQLIDATLERWTPSMLAETVERDGLRRQRHSRQSILLRLLYHEAYHAGEINIALNSSGRDLFDPWPSADWTIDRPDPGS